MISTIVYSNQEFNVAELVPTTMYKKSLRHTISELFQIKLPEYHPFTDRYGYIVRDTNVFIKGGEDSTLRIDFPETEMADYWLKCVSVIAKAKCVFIETAIEDEFNNKFQLYQINQKGIVEKVKETVYYSPESVEWFGYEFFEGWVESVIEQYTQLYNTIAELLLDISAPEPSTVRKKDYDKINKIYGITKKYTKQKGGL